MFNKSESWILNSFRQSFQYGMDRPITFALRYLGCNKLKIKAARGLARHGILIKSERTDPVSGPLEEYRFNKEHMELLKLKADTEENQTIETLHRSDEGHARRAAENLAKKHGARII